MNVAAILDWLLHFTAIVERYVLDFSESLWIYPGVFVLSLLDGFFPVVPSESVIIATATTSLQTGKPLLVLIFVAGAIGAWCGDQIAYLIGARADVRQWRIFRRGRWLRSLDWAENQLERRGATLIVAARFIPMGRVLVNLSAGALRYPHRRFMGVDAVAVTIWSAWSVALGTVAGAIFPEDNLLLSISVGVVAGVVLGFAVEKILSWIGFEKPTLPDLAADIEESLTPEERAAAEALEAEREARREQRIERRELITGSIPIMRRERDDDAGDEDTDAEDTDDEQKDDAGDSRA